MVTRRACPSAPPIDFFTFVFSNQLYLAAFTVPPAGSGADLNGDGQVNDLDYTIWKQNFGTSGPAGDTDGDGASTTETTRSGGSVLRTISWCRQRQGGFGLGGCGAVPEPTSAVLVLAGMLARSGATPPP